MCRTAPPGYPKIMSTPSRISASHNIRAPRISSGALLPSLSSPADAFKPSSSRAAIAFSSPFVFAVPAFIAHPTDSSILIHVNPYEARKATIQLVWMMAFRVRLLTGHHPVPESRMMPIIPTTTVVTELTDAKRGPDAAIVKQRPAFDLKPSSCGCLEVMSRKINLPRRELHEAL